MGHSLDCAAVGLRGGSRSGNLPSIRAGLGEGIIIIWGGQTTKTYEGLGKGRRIRFYPEDLEEIQKQIPEVEKVGGEYNNWGASITYKKKTVSQRVNGVYPEL